MEVEVTGNTENASDLGSRLTQEFRAVVPDLNIVSEKSVKLGYQKLEDKLQQDQERLIADKTPRELGKTISFIEKMLPGVKGQSTLSKDLTIFRNITEYAVKQGSNIYLNENRYSLDGVLQIIRKNFSNGTKIDLTPFGEFAIRRSRMVPTTKLPTLFGLQSFEPKKKQRAQRRSLTQDLTLTEKVMVGLQENKMPRSQSLTIKGRQLYKKVAKSGGMPLAQALDAPTFDDLVQSAFQLAHLVREGKVDIKLKDGEVVTEPSVENKEKPPIGRQKMVLYVRYSDFLQLQQNRKNDINEPQKLATVVEEDIF